MFKVRFLLPVLLLLSACVEKPATDDTVLNAKILEVRVGGVRITPVKTVTEVPYGAVSIEVEYTSEVSIDPVSLAFVRLSGCDLEASQGKDPCTLVFTPVKPLFPMTKYTFSILGGEGFGVNLDETFKAEFITAYDTSDKFPRIPDDELLTKVQQQTFKYFWDYAHPGCGLARERLGSGNTVTTGGSGFGISAIPVAVSRGFITREAAAERMRKILAFLSGAERFHGAFPHWINGDTGKAIAFSTKDNGADLVETAFLIEGLLTAQAFFDKADEADIRSSIEAIWHDVEWDWFTKGGEKKLYWHWSPDYDWQMNMPITGWNEALIIYVLAASSPTHPITKDVYDQGWARGGGMKPSVNGPLFFAHYSFLGLDPRGLGDAYCDDYFEHNVAHARYNYDYCVRNPGRHAGYSASSWGLTASDIPGGYTASSPGNDRGVIAPTAALASFPYVPEEAMAALHTFYYIYGDKLWGEYGFKDAFCLDSAWFASSYIAIDQGPIVVMIENYRTQLCWNLFMTNQDVLSGLSKLGFTR